MHLTCSRCAHRVEISEAAWRCPACGGLLNLADPPMSFSTDDAAHGMWRYHALLPAAARWREVTMGEGGTPLVTVDSGLIGKLEYASPTLSFKDRGVAVLLSRALELGAKSCLADSSGNAGVAVAAYAARAGLEAEIFVPEATSAKKIEQVRRYGANVVVVPGSREDTAAAARSRAESSDAIYASHVYDPLFYEGTMTYFLELYEQLGGRLPQTVVAPVGNGTLVLGLERALQVLRSSGLVAVPPNVLAVQSAACPPLARAFHTGAATPVIGPTVATNAEGIAIAEPLRGEQVLRALRDMGGTVVTVTDAQVARARDVLARRGVDVEPTAAASTAAVLALRDGTLQDVDGSLMDTSWAVLEEVVVPFCGAGLKAG